jgi:chromosome segregation ATPase
LQASAATAQQHHSNLKNQLQTLAAQRAEIHAQLSACPSGKCITASSLVSQIAAAEAEVQQAQAAAALAVRLGNELKAKQHQLQQQHSRIHLLQEALSEKQTAAQDAGSCCAHVTAAGAAGNDAVPHKQADAEQLLARRAAGVAQQQSCTDARSRELKRLTLQLAASEQNLQQLGCQQVATSSTTITTPVGSTAAVRAATAAAVTAQHQQLAHMHQQVLQVQMEMRAAGAAINSNSISSVLSAWESSTKDINFKVMPLHACFSLKASVLGDKVGPDRLLPALSAIAGPTVLQVLIVADALQAEHMLSAAANSTRCSGKLKIWPLQALQARSQLEAQRVAQQHLGHDKVWVPLDLIDYQPAYHTAMLRAFGSFVIAADDSTAGVLMECYGISSVTLDGTISKRGTMSGGWVGSAARRVTSLWHHKLHHDKAALRLQQLQTDVAAGAAILQHLQEEYAAAELQKARAEQAQHVQQEVALCRTAVEHCSNLLQHDQQLLQELQDSYDQQKRLQHDKNHKCSSGGPSSSEGTASQRWALSAQQQLQAAQAAAAEAAKVAEQLEDAQLQVICESRITLSMAGKAAGSKLNVQTHLDNGGSRPQQCNMRTAHVP